MKRAMLIATLFYIVNVNINITLAQSVEKGNIYFGAFGSWAIFDDYGFSGYLETRFEYLLLNNLSIGSDVGLTHTNIDFGDHLKYGSINIAPFTKYYFLDGKISPVLEIKYLHGFTYRDPENQRRRKDFNTLFLNAGFSTPRLIADRVGFNSGTSLGLC